MLYVLAQATPVPLVFDTESALSWGVAVFAIGVAVRVAVLLTRIDEKLRSALEALTLLAPIPGEVALLKQRMSRAEGDLDELWAIQRDGGSRRRSTDPRDP